MNSVRWPDQSKVERSLDELVNHDGLTKPANPLTAELVAAVKSDAYLASLAELGTLPSLPVECAKPTCGKRLGKWKLNPGVGIAEPDYAPQRAESPAPKPFTARVAVGKGNIVDGPNTHDGLGTFTYVCSQCHRNIRITAQRRTVLYLTALRDKQQIIEI